MPNHRCLYKSFTPSGEPRGTEGDEGHPLAQCSTRAARSTATRSPDYRHWEQKERRDCAIKTNILVYDTECSSGNDDLNVGCGEFKHTRGRFFPGKLVIHILPFNSALTWLFLFVQTPARVTAGSCRSLCPGSVHLSRQGAEPCSPTRRPQGRAGRAPGMLGRVHPPLVSRVTSPAARTAQNAKGRGVGVCHHRVTRGPSSPLLSLRRRKV